MDDERARPTVGVWNLIGIGSYLAACLAAGMGVGWLADDWLASSPVFTLVGLVLGIAVGVLGVWLQVKRFLV
jgi:F0F1-type ATP synthase assembly protein I